MGVDFCGIMGRRGAHVFYHFSTVIALLVFTVAHIAALRGKAEGGDPESAYYASWDESLGVVAWHDGPQTYAICANLPRARLLDLADGERAATAEGPGFSWSPRPVFALAHRSAVH